MKPRTTEFEALLDSYAEAVAAHEFGYAQNCSDQDNVNSSANETRPAVDRTRAALIAWADKMHALTAAQDDVIETKPGPAAGDRCEGCGRYRPAHHKYRLCTE